jgi:hypothetical protein
MDAAIAGRCGRRERGREGGREGGLSVTLSLSRARITEQLADAWSQAGTGAGAVETLPAPARAQAAFLRLEMLNFKILDASSCSSVIIF